MNAFVDPIPLAQALMRAPSVTPVDAGALDVLEGALTKIGFRAKRYRFGDVDNLYARYGEAAPNFCFAGHTDVVPPGEGWSVDPFSAEIRDGMLIGRGAADMKTAIAAMAAAAEGYIAAHGTPRGSISFLIAGDEEGASIDGTLKVLPAIEADGERLDHCLVGEPTSEARAGDTLKNGRRGSLNCVITIEGRQGHVAYPMKALNPVTPLMEALNALKSHVLDEGAPGFDPSNLEVTTIDVGNPAHNVIPGRASAKLNIRFNTAQTAENLKAWILTIVEAAAAKHGAKADVRFLANPGAPFYTAPGPFTDLLVTAARETLGVEPELSTKGGTSDARFIKDYCPVAELGLINATAHMVDERVAVEDIRALARCYQRVLELYFSR